jgi:acetyl-CoA synthetase
MKYCAVAGEPLNPEVYNQFYNATGIKLMEGYGQTELTVTAATYPWMELSPVLWVSLRPDMILI